MHVLDSPLVSYTQQLESGLFSSFLGLLVLSLTLATRSMQLKIATIILLRLSVLITIYSSPSRKQAMIVLQGEPGNEAKDMKQLYGFPM